MAGAYHHRGKKDRDRGREIERRKRRINGKRHVCWANPKSCFKSKQKLPWWCLLPLSIFSFLSKKSIADSYLGNERSKLFKRAKWWKFLQKGKSQAENPFPSFTSYTGCCSFRLTKNRMPVAALWSQPIPPQIMAVVVGGRVHHGLRKLRQPAMQVDLRPACVGALGLTAVAAAAASAQVGCWRRAVKLPVTPKGVWSSPWKAHGLRIVRHLGSVAGSGFERRYGRVCLSKSRNL